MKYGKLYKKFLEAVPEATDFCGEKEKQFFLDESDGDHILFSFAVRPYISKVLHDGDDELLKKIAAFMEKMEVDEDANVAGVVEQSVLEGLISEDRKLVEEKAEIWGKETKEAFIAVGQFIE